MSTLTWVTKDHQRFMMNTVTVHEYKKYEEWKVSGGEKMEEEAIG